MKNKNVREYRIQDIDEMKIRGVVFEKFHEELSHHEDYFTWTPITELTKFKSSMITGGYLNATYHIPDFLYMETHLDKEIFFFTSGIAIMPFADMLNGVVDPDSVQIARIKPQTLLVVDAGKAHFVAVSENKDTVQAIVVSPIQDAPRIELPFVIRGI